MAFRRFYRSPNLSRAGLKKEVGNRVGDDPPSIDGLARRLTVGGGSRLGFAVWMTVSSRGTGTASNASLYRRPVTGLN